MSSDLCGSQLLLALPDDIFSVITSSLSPRDVCSLGLSCPGLNAVVSSDKVWLSQCNKLGIKLLPFSTLVEWRKGVSSYKALCRFLVSIHPLIGIWVHQNPELGNVVYVMPGFLSVVGCRIIPQTIGPLGLEDGPLLWTSVFEILCKSDGSTAFFLHGREQGADYVYPGLFKSVDRNCNVLLLEVEALHQRDEIDKGTEIPFSRLESDDREMLLDFVTRQVRGIVPDTATAILFPPLRTDEVDSQQDFTVLHERRLLLLQMYERMLNPTEFGSSEAGDGDQVLEQILRKSSSTDGGQENQSTLHQFLRSSDRVGLCLRAATMELSFHMAWPHMDDDQSILYKMPMEPPDECHKYAGLWGGAYGWPPTRVSEEKAGEALFLISISYEVTKWGKKLMIGTKILEGTSYVEHPNGSAMFTANVDEPALESFPSYGAEDSESIDSFGGESIASGYGFRNPGSEPGSLFVLSNGLLCFVSEESRTVLTFQRFDLADLLKRGERLPLLLPPVSNYVYPMRWYVTPYSGISDS
ncbi:PREDICTED: F-box protein At5g39450-like [Erythranthe guttata]|uniref:F-box protein At5g39450-like n=1 Tax=Erythranthe guttata TaxID=4155 RepID=UPI00064DCFA7|nr:PREDICTED: F-box protein At5g39450-like [Erythranthe guttata]|eukprot:XP_012844455.1 PREDICTED: F-box protein At5g39450-like [Erythranthe guttata]